MTLLHYSTEPLILDNRTYNQGGDMKPQGLWLSVDAEWKLWNDSNLGYPYTHTSEVTIDLTNILVIDTEERFLDFNDQYKTQLIEGFDLEVIDWLKVSENYKGILINPYIWKFRLKYIWYYGWDIPSACIWDISAIEEVNPCSI